VVQAQHLDAGDFLDHPVHDGAGCFQQLNSHLFHEIASLVGLERFDQMLFGRGENSLEADHKQITDQVGVDALGAAAHVFLLKAAHALADGGFDFT
jgi:hypothetical protein